MKGSTFINELLAHILNNTTIPLIGDATGLLGAATVGSLYVSLHTADPGAGGAQDTSECAYPSYARVAVARTSGAWTVASQQFSNAAAVAFPTATGGSETATHVAIGTAGSGTGKILWTAPLGTSSQGCFTAVAATDVFTIPGHTLSVGDNVTFYPFFSSSLPTGITAGTPYFVKTVSGDDITISATSGGATLNITTAGDGFAIKSTTLAISNNIQPQFAIGALVFTEG